MTLLQHYYFSLLSVPASSALIGLWALFQNGNKSTTRLFLLYSTLIAIWGFCQAQAGITDSPAKSLFWTRMMFHAVIPAPILLTYFFAAVLKEKPHRSSLAGWPLLLGFVPLLYWDQFLRTGGHVGFLPSFPRAGPLFLIFNTVWIGWVLYALSILAKKAANKQHPQSKQARFLLIWFTFGYLTGSLNYLYLYGICLPPLLPFASYGVPLSWAVLAYGVFAYRIFDARIAIRKSLVYSTLITVLTVGYFALVYGIEKIFQIALGYQSAWISFSSFALMALFFQPLKIGIQRVVDRIIFRVPHEQVIKKMERLERETQETEKLRAVATLAGGLCHELRNPLQVIQTHAEFLPERYQSETFRLQCTNAMQTEIARINDLLKQLMDFAKPKAPSMRPLEPHKILDSTLDLLNNEFVKRNIDLEKQYLANGAQVNADPNQLRQVILNLILNAVQAIGKDGRIAVTTRQENNWFVFEVQDSGPGIPPEILPRLFEPFTTTKEDGNGLGLSVSHAIVKEHGGRLFADSQPGQGAHFVIQLPII